MQQQRRRGRQISEELHNSAIWGHAHFPIMIGGPAEPSTECRVPDVYSVFKKRSLSAPTTRTGDLWSATRYMAKILFWHISDGAHMLRPCGDRAAKARPGQSSSEGCSERRISQQPRMIMNDIYLVPTLGTYLVGILPSSINGATIPHVSYPVTN